MNLDTDVFQFHCVTRIGHGIDQSGESFEGRVFLNNPEAGIDTPPDPRHGYAGSFSVYGYGIWPGPPGEASAGPETIRAPIEKDLIATEAVRAAAAKTPEVTVTIVPVYHTDPVTYAGDAMKLKDVSIEIHP